MGSPLEATVAGVVEHLSRSTDPAAQVIFHKHLSKTDTTARLAIPSRVLQNFAGLEGADFPVTDGNGEVWTFRFSTRSRGHPRPVFTSGWLEFARAKRLEVQDVLVFTRLEDGQYKIHVFRDTNIRLLGTDIGLTYVDQFQA